MLAQRLKIHPLCFSPWMESRNQEHSDDSGFTFFFKFCSDVRRESAGGPPRSTKYLPTVEEAYLVPGDFPEAARKHFHLGAVCSSLKENSPRRLMRVVGREAGDEDKGPGGDRVIWIQFSWPDDISVTFELGVRKRTQPCVHVGPGTGGAEAGPGLAWLRGRRAPRTC